jgi:Ca-activated chloride channel family protein
MNKKKIILLSAIFLFLAVTAIVYSNWYCPQGDTSRHYSERVIPGTISQPKPITVSSPSSNVLFEWKLGNPYLLKNGSGDVFLDLRVNGKPLPDVKRKQMNLVLVIDRSGSMGSENKLVQVKNAAASIIENMNATDRLAVVIYDDTVQTLIPSSPVENKARLREIIYSLSPGGSTNLCGGIQQGFEEARRNFNRNYVNRIILLSDGLANAGITDPDQINAEAKQIRENFISVSTMGVGIDYNENLMANLADVSGGNYYYVSKEVNMAEVFRKEWNLMQNLIATNARATFQLGKNVDVVDVAGFQWEKKGTKLTIQVPDIYSGENKRILVQLHAPADTLKVVPLGTGELAFTEVTGEKAIPVNLTFAPSIRVVEDQNLVAKNFSREVQTKVSQVAASRRMQEAYRLLEEGKREDAYNVAYDAEQKLRSLGYVENKAQLNRYKSVLGMLSPATAALSEPDAKDMLKKQKEADRTEVQSEPQ